MIPSGEVHLWSAPLTAAPEELLALSNVLSTEETARANRFRFQEHRDAFVIARGMLRFLIAHYAGGDPQDVQFNYAPYGKPSIAGELSLSFNLSHSGSLALYAFARERELGVDIEQFRPMSDLEQVAKHFFSKGEVDDLFSLDEDGRSAAFFRCWTRKEAFVKAIGDGLSMPLDSFRVSLKADEPATLLDAPPEHRGKWSLRDVTPSEGYAAALVFAGQIDRLAFTRIPDVTSGVALALCSNSPQE